MIDMSKTTEAKQLYDKGEYSNALESINVSISRGDTSNAAFILRGRVLEALGRIEECSEDFWHKINWKIPSEDDVEMIRLTSQAAKAQKWDLIEYRLNYILERMTVNNNGPIITEVGNKLLENLRKIELGEIDSELLLETSWLYTASNNVAFSAVYLMAYQKYTSENLEIIDVECGKVNSFFPNISDIYMYLQEDVNHTICLAVGNEEDTYHYNILANILLMLGKKVLVILPEIDFDVEDEEYDLEYFVQHSFNNSETHGQITYYVPMSIQSYGKYIESTTYRLLYLLAVEEKGHLPLFAERNTLDQLIDNEIERKHIHYQFNAFEHVNSRWSTCFGYILGYKDYLSLLYEMDIDEALNKKSGCDYSIVIPVRNNAATLANTIDSCLMQNYSDFEILISDNSDRDDFNIKNLVKKYKDIRIKYIRTPRNLPIAKSFEYAYLNAAGEFIISLGADDALMPDAFNNLNSVFKQFPQEELIMWDTIHYVWPEFMFSNQSDQMIIKRMYEPKKLRTLYLNSQDILNEVINFRRSQYAIPLLYINSGFKRDYLKRILKETGAMIDGIAQDIYTGLVNLTIKEKILYLQYPITMAALSSNSSGAVSLKGVTDQETTVLRDKEYLDTNVGINVERGMESLIIRTDGDISVVYASLFRLIDMNCLPDSIIDTIDWKRTIKNIIEQLQYDDIHLEKVFISYLNFARSISEETYQWLINEFNNGEVSFLKNVQGSEKDYFKGIDQYGSLHIDASDFGVVDVNTAVEFVGKLLQL